jgi:hypothetical protein
MNWTPLATRHPPPYTLVWFADEWSATWIGEWSPGAKYVTNAQDRKERLTAIYWAAVDWPDPPRPARLPALAQQVAA